MQRRKTFLIAFLSVSILIIVGVCIYFTAKGCRDTAVAAAAMRRAEQDWHNRQVAESLSEFSVALRLGLVCGVRHQMAQPHINHMLALYRSGNLEGAIAECVTASRRLGGCDAKEIAGSLDYWCNVMEMQLVFPSTPSPEGEHYR